MSAQHKKQPHHQQQRKHAADKEAAEIAALERRLREEAPPSGVPHFLENVLICFHVTLISYLLVHSLIHC